MTRILIIIIWLALATSALADQCLGVDPSASMPLHEVTKTTGCHVGMSASGYPLPDPDCTPGAVNPTVTVDVLRNQTWRTRCVRNGATTPEQKRSVYSSYGIRQPRNNSGKTQTCEIDHLVSIEMGGADTLDNLWPQCGPADQPLAKRWFKVKDGVENDLTRRIKTGSDPAGLQRGIAEDWSQYAGKLRR